MRRNEIGRFFISLLLFLMFLCCFLQPAYSQSSYIPGSRNLPEDFPEITINIFDNPSNEYIFAAPFSHWGWFPDATPYLTIMDNFGTPVFYRKMDGTIYDFKLQHKGLLTYFNKQKHYVLDSSYRIIDSLAIIGFGEWGTDFHDLQIFPNGHSFLIGFENRIVNMDTVVPGGHPGVLVKGMIIQEHDSAGEVIFQWSSWDHYLITDAVEYKVDLADSLFIDYVHANAIEIDSDTTLLISARNLDEITKIDRRTGEIIWRLWGKNNDFEFINDTLGFSLQHDIRRIENGNYTLFDNGYKYEPTYSSAVEYELDEVNMTATLINRYRSQPDDIYGVMMGSAQWLPNGNIFVGWGSGVPNITEFNPDGTKTWEMEFPSLNYRAFRFNWATNLFTTDKDSVDFGYIYFQNSKEMNIRVTNKSDRYLTLTGLFGRTNYFTPLTEFPFSIPAYGTDSITILFSPDTAGYYQDVITLCSDIEADTLVQRIAIQLFLEAHASAGQGSNMLKIEPDIKHYPNPHNGIIRLFFPTSDSYAISVCDLLGHEIYTGERHLENPFLINLQGQKNGIRFIQILDIKTGCAQWIKSIQLR